MYILPKEKGDKREDLHLCEILDSEKKMIDMIEQSNDRQLKALLGEGSDLIAREARCHLTCRSNFFKKTQQIPVKEMRVRNEQIHMAAWTQTAIHIKKTNSLEWKAYAF